MRILTSIERYFEANVIDTNIQGSFDLFDVTPNEISHLKQIQSCIQMDHSWVLEKSISEHSVTGREE